MRKSVATYYRSSAVRTNELKAISAEIENKFSRFPAYFEVRFVEHLVNLAECIFENLPAMQKHWNSVIESKHSNRIEKATARGFAKVWISGGDKEHITALMIDVLRVRKLQKNFQKSMATILDIEVSKKIAVSSLNMMEQQPLPEGEKERLTRRQIGEEEEVDDENCEKRKAFNSLVMTQRCRESVRNEIILSTKEFLTERVSDEQEKRIKNLKKFLHSKSGKEKIDCSRDIVESLFGGSTVEEFHNDVIGDFAASELPPSDLLEESGNFFSHFLKICPQIGFFETDSSVHSSNSPQCWSRKGSFMPHQF